MAELKTAARPQSPLRTSWGGCADGSLVVGAFFLTVRSLIAIFSKAGNFEGVDASTRRKTYHKRHLDNFCARYGRRTLQTT
jgi:hypothetical protein